MDMWNVVVWCAVGDVNSTPTAHTFFSCAFLSACLSQLVVTVVQVHTAT